MQIASVVHNSVEHDARVLKEAMTLASEGHDVTLFGLDPNSDREFVAANGVRVRLARRDLSHVKERLSLEGLRTTTENSVRTSFREQADTVFELVKRTMSPDVVHIHDHVVLNACSRFKDEWNVPIVWDAHEIYEELAGVADARAVVNPRIIREHAPVVDRFITLNPSIAQFYADRYPALPSAVLLPNASSYHRQAAYDGRLHTASELPSSQRILLFQGGFGSHRGIDALLRSAELLSPEWTVVFMGWGKLLSQIESFSKKVGTHENGLPRIVCLPGVDHHELPLWTAGASLGAIPYEPVGLNHEFCTPNKLWEYPLAGVPILATELTELRNYVDANRIGITVGRELDPGQLANAVNDLSQFDLDEMRIACRRFAVTDNWATHESKLIKLYSELETDMRLVGSNTH